MATPSAVVWVGGTSGLAKEYFAEFGLEVEGSNRFFVLAGHEAREPVGLLSPASGRGSGTPPGAARYCYEQLDMLDGGSVLTFFDRVLARVGGGGLQGATLVLSVRLSLVWGSNHVAMTNRLELLLSKAVDAGVRQVIHVSSVAVVDHVKDQREFTEANPLPSIDAYTGPYDIFKRVSEDIVGRVCRKRNVAFTNLRLGGIYSSSRGCIQMSSLRGQARIGIYFPNGMDLNSSRNASIAISMAISKAETKPQDLDPVYYYTRPGNVKRRLGDYIVLYRRALGITGVWVPLILVHIGFVFFHALARLLHGLIPAIDAIDYLIRVSETEHTFDNSLFRKHFPGILEREETIEECFKRIDGEGRQ